MPAQRTWRPADGPLPAVLALHGHDGVKYYGKEKIADTDVPPTAEVQSLRDELYEGRAYANDLAARGYVVPLILTMSVLLGIAACYRPGEEEWAEDEERGGQ